MWAIIIYIYIFIYFPGVTHQRGGECEPTQEGKSWISCDAKIRVTFSMDPHLEIADPDPDPDPG